MNAPVKISTIQKIANKKGLLFEYNKSLQSYVMKDKFTGETLMEYANITIGLITNANIWNEECNKLRVQAFR